ncbi:MAG: RluA family pseudouridine synthase [Ectothiorhodospiraceae bacterium]|nr:RluA family pseudouridine synthase [Ectothiorhodospiraceae bacterium]
MIETPDAVRGQVRHVTIDERSAGQRIDNFLLNVLRGVPRQRVYRCLRRGEVRVNRGRIRQDYRLQAGDVVRVPPLDVGAAPAPGTPAPSLVDTVGAAVLYEDESVLVLDKPAGIPVHAGSGYDAGIIEALRAARPEDRMLELAHRLDRDTSGCLLVARRRSAMTVLHAAFRDGVPDKRYWALVRGRWARPRRVRAALRRDVLRGGERLVQTAIDGKPAATDFTPLAVAERATLVEASPLTGRTHQIRVHAASVGHPIAGDEKYGEAEFDRAMRALGLRRLFLHAACLTFKHPTNDRPVTVRAPLPAELAAVLAELGLDAPGEDR